MDSEQTTQMCWPSDRKKNQKVHIKTLKRFSFLLTFSAQLFLEVMKNLQYQLSFLVPVANFKQNLQEDSLCVVTVNYRKHFVDEP